jgi:hypothetical protein
MARFLAIVLLFFSLHAAATDIVLPPVPFGATLRASFTLTTTSGAPIAGIPVTLTPLNGCGTIAGAASATVTTNGSGTATFDFVAGHTLGNCRIEGRNGSTVAYAVTWIFNPDDMTVTEFGSSTPRIKQLHTSTPGQTLRLWASAPNDLGARQPLDHEAVSVQVVPDDNGASATIRSVDAFTDTGSFNVLLDTNSVAGIYDLIVNVGGLVRAFRIVQSVDGTAPASTKALTGEPVTSGPVTLTLVNPRAPCALTSVAYRAPTAWPSNLPSSRAGFVVGMMDIGTSGCFSAVTLRLDFSEDIPAGSTFYTETWSGNASFPAQWTPWPTAISGKSVTVTFDQFPYSSSATPGGLAITGKPPVTPARPAVKDLWWSGMQENGWGMSIVQSSDLATVFPVVFAYDDKGAPTWWATGGFWDPAKNIWQMDVVQPRGTPYYAFDETLLAVGNVRGKAALTFADANNATFNYTIDGRTGSKTLQRQPFGVPSSSSVPDVGGMWWGGAAQSGWGISVAQQQSTLFSVWYSYDDRNYPTWVVMPGGTWTAANTYEGRVYRTHSSGWLGVTYDASKLTVTDVGSYRFVFNGSNATFTYTVDGRSGALALSRQAPF